jgi:hypothetical protein
MTIWSGKRFRHFLEVAHAITIGMSMDGGIVMLRVATVKLDGKINSV